MKPQPGALVIGVGLLFFAGPWTIFSTLYPVISGRANVRLWPGLPELWPMLLVIFGVAMLAQVIFRPEGQLGLVFLGIVILMFGLFLSLFTLKVGNLGWADLARLWPVFAIIIGFAFLIVYVADDLRSSSFLIPVYVVGGLGIFLLPVTLGLTRGSGFAQSLQLWPLLVLVLAILIFFRPTPADDRADSDSSPHRQ